MGEKGGSEALYKYAKEQRLIRLKKQRLAEINRRLRS
jgi:hypothetical protein